MTKSTQNNKEQQLARVRNSLVDAKHPVPQIMSGVVDIKTLSLELSSVLSASATFRSAP